MICATCGDEHDFMTVVLRYERARLKQAFSLCGSCSHSGIDITHLKAMERTDNLTSRERRNLLRELRRSKVAEYKELRRKGLSVDRAAEVIGINRVTGFRWEKRFNGTA